MGGEGLRIGSGMLLDHATHLLGGTVLVLSFALLCQRRIMAIINIFTLQGFVVALTAFSRGRWPDAPHFCVLGAIVTAAEVIVLPVGLRAIMRRLDGERITETASGMFATLAFGAGLVLLAILTVLPTALRQSPMTREDLALASSVVLLGLLMMATWRNAIAQVVGFMSLGNGLILVAIGLDGVPLFAMLCFAYLMMVAVIVSGIVVFRIRDHLGDADLHRLDAQR